MRAITVGTDDFQLTPLPQVSLIFFIITNEEYFIA
jgi:hypothetical protein